MFFRPRMFRFVGHMSFGYDYNYYYQINSLKSLSPLVEEGGSGGETLPSNSPTPQPPWLHASSVHSNSTHHCILEPKNDMAELELTELPASLGGWLLTLV